MASRKLLIHSAKLLNYLGEVDNVAAFQETNLNHCYCPLLFGTGLSSQGRNGNDSTRLYLFDVGTTWTDTSGNTVTYLPYAKWKELADKTGFWTISDKGDDYIVLGDTRLRIVQAIHRKNGSRRMWHWEVDCQ